MKVDTSSAREAFETLFLNPASAVVVAIATALMMRTHTSLAWLLNPWSVSPLVWLAGYAAVRVALLGFVDGLVWIVGPWLPPLPSRVGASRERLPTRHQRPHTQTA